jgi:SAM-dependent methyltransferase
MLERETINQASRPSGFFGRMVGEVIALTNRPRNRWLFDQLDVDSINLRALEFGFGNGEVLTNFLARSAESSAVGIDWSQSMIDAAISRNRAAVADGRLRLLLGSITDPKLDIGGPYDRIWSSNVIQMVDDRPALFARLLSALSDDGVLALAFQPRGPKAPPPVKLETMCVAELSQVGFGKIETRWMPKASPPAFCILAKA